MSVSDAKIIVIIYIDRQNCDSVVYFAAVLDKKNERKREAYSKATASSIDRKPLPPSPGQKELHHRVASIGTAEDTRHERDEGNAEDPSVGDTPQAPTTLEPNSSAMTEAAAGRPSLLHCPSFHKNQSCLTTPETKSQQTYLPSRLIIRRQPDSYTEARSSWPHLHWPLADARANAAEMVQHMNF